MATIIGGVAEMREFAMRRGIWGALLVASIALTVAVALGAGPMALSGRDRDGITATVQGDMLGGGSWRPQPMDAVVTGTDLAVRALVVDVEPTRVTNPDGRFRPIDPDGGPRQLHGQYIETPVKLKMLEVLGRRPEPAPHAATVVSVAAGQELTITVAGGRYEWTVSPEDARVLGIMAVEKGPDGSTREVHPTEPMHMTTEVQPLHDLHEGQEIIVFLFVQDESWRRTTRILNQGAFVLNAERTKGTPATGHAPAMNIDQIRRYAESVSKQEGRAATPDKIQRHH